MPPRVHVRYLADEHAKKRAKRTKEKTEVNRPCGVGWIEDEEREAYPRGTCTGPAAGPSVDLQTKTKGLSCLDSLILYMFPSTLLGTWVFWTNKCATED